MALVAYDYSDSSGAEEDEESATTAAVLLSKSETPQLLLKPKVISSKENDISDTTADASESVSDSSSKSLFNLLPQPSQKKPSIAEDDDEFLHKKESTSLAKPKAKITVPSLSDFKDVEPRVPSAKPKISNGKKSGLLCILPQPRNAVSAATTTKSFVPHVLTQKPTTVTKKALPTPMKKTKAEVKSLAQEYSDDSDDGEMPNDFFSMNKVDEPPIEDMPLDIVSVVQPKEVKPKAKTPSETLQSYFKQDVSEGQPETEGGLQEDTNQYDSSAPGYENGYDPGASNSNEAVLDDEAILKLCGSRGKRKREDIQIVDVNQKEVLADAREWLLKGLMDDTTKRVSASKKRGDGGPTSQQRRKHQITYLAHQAKANEAELQNQWANNRVTKRQTQSKYGF